MLDSVRICHVYVDKTPPAKSQTWNALAVASSAVSPSLPGPQLRQQPGTGPWSHLGWQEAAREQGPACSKYTTSSSSQSAWETIELPEPRTEQSICLTVFHHNLPQKLCPASWGWWQGHHYPLSRAERGAQLSNTTFPGLSSQGARPEETPHTLTPWLTPWSSPPEALSPRGRNTVNWE